MTAPVWGEGQIETLKRAYAEIKDATRGRWLRATEFHVRAVPRGGLAAAPHRPPRAHICNA
eukprot:4666210-Lingulodinium_polyedra.AAC.1